MRVALVAHGLPQPSSNGGPMTCWALLRELIAQGHGVRVVALHYPDDPFWSEEREDAVRAEGAELVGVAVGAESALTAPAGTVLRGSGTRVEDVFPTVRLRPAVEEALEPFRPEAILVYHWDSLASTHGLRAAPRLALVDDLWHLPNLRRWQHSRPAPSRVYAAWTLATLRGLRPAGRAMVELLEDCEAAASFQAQSAEWLRKRGASRCDYLRAPVLDGGGPDWRDRRAKAEGRLRILLGPSNLGATSTGAGLRLFADEILPGLERDLDSKGFEVRVVGEGAPPAELARLLPRADVTVTGRIEPADDEFLCADLQLVPTPFPLGRRVRIIVAWSFGCPVVAHSSEAINIPELRDRENALLARDGPGLADAVVRLARDRALRARVGEAGRATYDRLFRPDVAGREIVERLEQLTR